MDVEREMGRAGGARADQLADDLAALHRVATLPPGLPEERLQEWLGAARQALDAPVGLVLVSTEGGLTVWASNTDPRADRGGPGSLSVGDSVVDHRVETSMARAATVAVLAGGGSTGGGASKPADLGDGAVVVCPLWVSGRVSGAAVFVAPPERPAFSAWALACADIAADGVARVLEHQRDVLSLDSAESWADAVLRLIPDPVFRLDALGHAVVDGVAEPEVFDPCRGVRAPGGCADAASVELVQESVATSLDERSVCTAKFSAGTAPDDSMIEARFVPTGTGDVLCIVRDVTDLHRVEAALAEQVAFEGLVGALSTRLIGGAAGALDEAIEAGLADVAAFFGADVASIRELSDDGGSLHLTHRWSASDGSAGASRGERVDATDLERLTGADGSMHVFRRADEDHDVPSGFRCNGAKAVLWVRLGQGRHFGGVLGLEWQRTEPPVLESSLGLVDAAADPFHGAVRRRGVAVLAEGQSNVFESIARGEPVESSLTKARQLLDRAILGGEALLLTVGDEGVAMLPDPALGDWGAWFEALPLDLGNPYGQAVVTGEPVLVVDARSDPRFGDRSVPDDSFRSINIQPVRSRRDGRPAALIVLLGRDPVLVTAPRAVRDSVVSLVSVALERDSDLRRLAHQATHDPLTGVGNRAALLDRLHVTLARAQRSGLAAAVLYCDLDGFKSVNDEWGHDRGDRLLVEVAARIRSAVRPGDTVSRAGGDEFVVVCEDLEHRDQASAIAQRICSAVEDTPVDLGEVHLEVRISVGVAIADLVLDDPDRLLRAADLAMYESKGRQRRPRTVTADGTATSDVLERNRGFDAVRAPTSERFLVDLGSALVNGSLLLHQQPLVRRDGSLAGVEALVRWPEDEHGTLGPERIVSGAAELGMAGVLGRWVRRGALAARTEWPWTDRSANRGTRRPPPVHLNVSAAELVTPGFLGDLVDDLRHFDATADDLVIEIREKDLHRPDVAAMLDDLRQLEVPVIVDGVGRDGLSLLDLAGLPVRGIKVGNAVVRRLEQDPVALEVVRAWVLLAHGLGWQSLAVGVETDGQRAVLFGFGIDAVQGSNVTMPMAQDDFHSWLTEHRANR